MTYLFQLSMIILICKALAQLQLQPQPVLKGII